MNKISMDKKIAVVAALCEGCSVRSTVRLTGVSKGAVLRLLVEVGTACAEYLDIAVRNVPAKRIQIDEIWSFVGAKQKNVTPEMAAKRVCGDAWTFVAIDADTKLVISWMMRMCMRRFTRLTNAFSKKIENHMHSVALYYMYYHFVRIHQTLRVTPAMEAGISSHVWSIAEIVTLSSQIQILAA
jgi:hypothetical protein